MVPSLTPLQQVLAVLAGTVVGFSLGLIGGGGSILAVPLLLYGVGYPAPHVVIGTTALAVSATAYLNLIPHARRGHVRWRSAVIFALAGAVGAWGGSTLGKQVSGHALLLSFAALMVVVAVLMLRPPVPGGGDNRGGRGSRHTLRLLLYGLGAGVLSGFFGIGGGFLMVPGLALSTGMPILDAVGSSLVAVGTVGLSTALNYARSGLVDWRVAAEYLAGGVLGGWLGAWAAAWLGRTRRALTYVYSAVLILVALYMVLREAGPRFPP